QTTISGVGLLSSSATATLANATLDRVTVGSADINGGTIDGITSLTADGDLDIGAHDLRAATLTADGLTATRVVFAGANGVLSDDSDMTFSGDTLTVTKLGAFTAAGAINFDSQNMTNVDVDSGTIDGATLGATNTINVTAVDIDGGTDIGADLNKADLFLVDDGADGTNRKSTLERVSTYLQGKGLLTGSSGELKVVPVVATFFSASTNNGAAGGMSSDLVTASFACATQGHVLNNSLEVYLNGMLQLASASAATSATGTKGIFDYQITSSINGFRDLGQTEQTRGNISIHLAAALDSDDILTVKYLSHGLDRTE
ncbi:MAG TPA: hypothetical protein DCW74_09850, partial [Alteromonas australica]|nr:hypothetical protein [Alteromonas australica]